MSDLEYWVWLGMTIGAGSPRVDEILAKFESARHFYNHGKPLFDQLSWIKNSEKEKHASFTLEDAKVLIAKSQKNGYDILCYEDVNYPIRLRNIYSPPCVLYVQGNTHLIEQIDHEIAISMVGMRKASDYGRLAAKTLGRDLGRAGAVVVSGLALGVDAAAHTGCLDAGGQTIAVLGCGLDVPYPPENKELMHRIMKQGAVVTEYAPGTAPLSKNFPVRNRIIAGLSLGTVVVEAAHRSGSLITANIALEQGKDVFAVPGSIFNPGSQGTLRLLRDGAVAVGGAADILKEYRYAYEGKLKLSVLKKSQPPPVTETPIETFIDETPASKSVRSCDLEGDLLILYNALESEPRQLELLIRKTGLSAGKLLSCATQLEMQGLLASYPGRRFARA